MKKTTSGFTIVELLIVIVVIAILAAISIVAYTGIQSRAKTSSAQTAAANLEKKVQLYYIDEGHYPLRFSDLAGASPSEVYYLTGVTLGGTLTNSTPENAVHYAPCGSGNPANIAGITASNIVGAILYYRNYSNSNNDYIRIGTTSTTSGVACFWSTS